MKRYCEGAPIFELSARSTTDWPVYVLTDLPSAADQALRGGQSMLRLCNATVLSVAHDSESEPDECLAMLCVKEHSVDVEAMEDWLLRSCYISEPEASSPGITYLSATAALWRADHSCSLTLLSNLGNSQAQV